MKKMLRFAVLAVLAMTLVTSKTVRRDQPTPECYPNCTTVTDQPTPECYPNCTL